MILQSSNPCSGHYLKVFENYQIYRQNTWPVTVTRCKFVSGKVIKYTELHSSNAVPFWNASSLCANEGEEKIYFIKLLNIFYVSSMFSEVRFFFLTLCSFDVDCDSAGKPHCTKKSQCCYYNDSRIALSFRDDVSNLCSACIFYSITMQVGLFLVINSSTINSRYKNAAPFWTIGSLPVLRSDLFISFSLSTKIFTLYFIDVHMSRRLHVGLERNINVFRFILWDLNLCWHFVSCCIIQGKENKLTNMVSVAYQPLFQQSAVKHPRSLEQIKVTLIGYTCVLRVLGSSHGLSYDRSIAYSKASSPKTAI